MMKGWNDMLCEFASASAERASTLVHTGKWGWTAALVAGGTSFVLDAPNIWRTAGVVLLLCLGMDMLTGMVAAVFVHGRHITSGAMARTMAKGFCYGVLLIVAACLDEIAGSRYALSTTVLTLGAFLEMTSVLENTRAIWEKLGLSWPFGFLGDRLRELGKEEREKHEDQ